MNDTITCPHGIRHPWVCHECDEAAWNRRAARSAPEAGKAVDGEAALRSAKPIIEALIAQEYNVETWGLKSRLAAIEAALTSAATEPVAWMFELANARNTETDEPCNWGKPQLSFTPPCAGKYQRNVTPLYSALASPAPSGAEPVAWQWRALEDGEPRTAWKDPDLGDRPGWEALAKRNPEKFAIERRALYSVPQAPDVYATQAVAPAEEIADPPPEIIESFHKVLNEVADLDGLELAEHWMERATASEAEASDLRRKLEEHRRALEPFGEDAGNWADSVPDDYRPLCTEPGETRANPGSDAAFTVGDLRRARALTTDGGPNG